MMFFDEAFEQWWAAEGQFVRAGGGDYEKSFAYDAWRHLHRKGLVQSVATPDALSGAQAKGYVAGGAQEFLYPEAGDHPPPGGVKVHLLTAGGICIEGKWRLNAGFMGWAPLPRRNYEKEKLLPVSKRLYADD